MQFSLSKISLILSNLCLSLGVLIGDIPLILAAGAIHLAQSMVSSRENGTLDWLPQVCQSFAFISFAFPLYAPNMAYSFLWLGLYFQLTLVSSATVYFKGGVREGLLSIKNQLAMIMGMFSMTFDLTGLRPFFLLTNSVFYIISVYGFGHFEALIPTMALWQAYQARTLSLSFCMTQIVKMWYALSKSAEILFWLLPFQWRLLSHGRDFQVLPTASNSYVSISHPALASDDKHANHRIGVPGSRVPFLYI